MNLRIEKVKNQIINTVNDSGLPIGVIHYILKDLSKDVANEYHRILLLEQQQMTQSEQTENNETENEQNTL